ncbi:hypothetical protein Esi_0297_0035 [Ectocarpus siliculosus]|uniref:Uncharacterized protein n=1 Tax=Ectocarpus siliculosus TaxID=2880 RepID=D7FVP8_ECTSI|nr:hypothetical protein Esi_0297_0035 [Ectocarpus siliculosus]|eukprot:CBJ31969.1 hypothetical protein Esi_0297_0035 [Ectocarpus siliculosus]
MFLADADADAVGVAAVLWLIVSRLARLKRTRGKKERGREGGRFADRCKIFTADVGTVYTK